MRTKEILCFALLFIFCFLITEFLVGLLFLENPLQRFIGRIGIQVLFYGVVYLVFDSIDINIRLKDAEKLHHDKTPEDDGNTSSEAEGS